MPCLSCLQGNSTYITYCNLHIVYITHKRQICSWNYVQQKPEVSKTNQILQFPLLSAYPAWQSQHKCFPACILIINAYNTTYRVWASMHLATHMWASTYIFIYYGQVYESTTNTHAHRALKGSSSNSQQNLREQWADHGFK